MKKTALILAAIFLSVSVFSCVRNAPVFASPDPVIVLPGGEAKDAVIPASCKTPFSLDLVPEYRGDPCAAVNGGEPYFTDNEKVATSYEYYSVLDRYGRCGAAVACVGDDLMPTEDREYIGLIKPSGWRSDRYEWIDGEYLFNRCHLIGFQLSGENANERNLITGTRYMNVSGMLPYENLVAEYVRKTKKHVLYRVTPVFRDDEAIARGVLMEAFSTEDNGEGVRFCVFAYNVQPDIILNYLTGENRFNGVLELPEYDFIINVKSGKFHKPTCKYALEISEDNAEHYHGSKQSLTDKGYKACGFCKP